MNLIERYIFKKASFAGLLILGSLLGVVWIVQALREVDIIAANGQSILTYLSITTLAVPGLILAIIPIALLLASIYTMNALNSNSELVVVSATGSSNWRIAKPLVILGLICSLITGIVGHILAPISLAVLREQISEMRADLITVIVREGTFNTIEENLTFHIAERGAGGILNGILISDERDEDVSILYSAKEGIVIRREEGSFLLLNDGEIHQKDNKQDAVTVVKYQSYLFDLSTFSAEVKGRTPRAKERTTLELLSPDVNDSYYKAAPERFAARIHERFSEMLWPFAYVFVVLAYAGQARSSRQGYATSVMAAVTVVSVARGMGFSAVSALKTDPSAVLYTYLIPCACIAFGLYFVVRNRPVSLPKPVLDQLEKFNARLANQLSQAADSYKRYRRRRAGVEA